MSCKPKCYVLSPTGYDSGVYQLDYYDVDPVWFYPVNSDGDRLKVATPALITELSSLVNDKINPPVQVTCNDASSGCCRQYISQLCYTNGDETLSVAGLFDLTSEPLEWVDVTVISGVTDYLVGDKITGIPTDYYQVPCQYNTTTEEVTNVSSKCYLETVKAPIDPYLTSATSDLGSLSASGRGYAKLYDWTDAQFANEGDAGGGTEGYHSLVTTDVNGIPTVNGEYTTSNVTNITSNSNSAYGDFKRWETLIINPTQWNGDEVGTIRINDQ